MKTDEYSIFLHLQQGPIVKRLLFYILLYNLYYM